MGRGAWSPLLSTAVAGVLLAGCGSSDPTATFKGSFSPVIHQIRGSAIAIGREIQRAPSQDDAQVASAFAGLATRWQDQLSRLQTLKPPPQLAAQFNTLTGAATRVESDLNAIVAAARTHSTAAARQGGASVVQDILAAKAASTGLTSRLGIR